MSLFSKFSASSSLTLMFVALLKRGSDVSGIENATASFTSIAHSGMDKTKLRQNSSSLSTLLKLHQ